MIGHSFVRPKRPFLRPDLPIGRAPRADAVQDARLRAPAQPARSVLDRVEHGASLAARDDHTPLRGVPLRGVTAPRIRLQNGRRSDRLTSFGDPPPLRGGMTESVANAT